MDNFPVACFCGGLVEIPLAIGVFLGIICWWRDRRHLKRCCQCETKEKVASTQEAKT